MKYRLGVDIGGTFTDFALLDEDSGRMSIHKRLTSPEDPSVSVLLGTKELLERCRVAIDHIDAIVHGTTLVTNAIIERKGAVTGMLATAGFRDVLDIAKEQRYVDSDLRLRFPQPVVPRPHRREVRERVHFDGRVETELSLDELRKHVGDLVDEYGIEAIAVCFLHSYANSSHEKMAKALIEKEFPNLYLSISCEVSPFIKEWERWTTTTVNAYTQPMVDRYLRALERGYADMGFEGDLFVMTSNAGTATPGMARRFPVRLVESGPVAGALMSAYHSRLLEQPNVLSFDMGGTTAKGTIIGNHTPLRKDQIEVAHVYGFKKGSGLPLRMPVIDMIEIGSGGGSIARPDRRGVVAVGPQSAGANPGPACYGLGGADATLTDANLVLGYLDPGFFLGGQMRLVAEESERVIARNVAQPLALGALRAAWGIHETVNEDVARAFRVHASQRGFDYRTCSMIAFGGSGPIHALRIARKLRIPRVIFPAAAGVMSAFGLLASPVNHEIIKTENAFYDDLSAEAFAGKFELLSREVSGYIRAAGVEPPAIRVRFGLDMRYVGQGYEIGVPLPEGASLTAAFKELPALFADNYEKVFSTRLGDRPTEIVNWKARATGPLPGLGGNGYLLGEFAAASGGEALKGHRPAYFPEAGDRVSCPVYDRYALAPGTEVQGPALIEENESTCVLGLGDKAVVDARYNLVAEVVPA
jgi:N-methylhydantoinase A